MKKETLAEIEKAVDRIDQQYDREFSGKAKRETRMILQELVADAIAREQPVTPPPSPNPPAE